MTTLGIFFLITISYLVMALEYPFAYIVATYEDLVGEWAQFYLFLATMLLAMSAARVKSRYRWFYCLLALACFYVAGEEISWGQRIFNIESPDFFKKHNLQGETTLHNFFTGPVKTFSKDLFEYLIAAGLVAYGFIYPLLLRLRFRLALWTDGKGIPSPPLYLWPFFVTSAYLELGRIKFNEAEVAEILIPAALALMITEKLVSKGLWGNPLEEDTNDVTRNDLKLSARFVVLFVSVTLLATGTAWICYQTPHLHQKMVNRYLNGAEKFAKRYARNDSWQKAAMLYEYVQQKEPHRTSIHRKLYRCYQQLGDQEKMQKHFRQALDIDRSRLAEKPDSMSANVSMARNYRMVGDLDRAFMHLDRALTVGLQRQAERPGSGSTAYWLGKVYRLMGQEEKAYLQLRKAVELRPHRKKYREALVDLERDFDMGDDDS